MLVFSLVHPSFVKLATCQQKCFRTQIDCSGSDWLQAGLALYPWQHHAAHDVPPAQLPGPHFMQEVPPLQHPQLQQPPPQLQQSPPQLQQQHHHASQSLHAAPLSQTAAGCTSDQVVQGNMMDAAASHVPSSRLRPLMTNNSRAQLMAQHFQVSRIASPCRWSSWSLPVSATFDQH